jgi:PST family polysaccharide transporter
VGFVWAYGSFLSGKLVNFLATLVLARLLVPEQFGVVVFALAVIAYLDAVCDLGVGAALVYRSDAEDPRVASSAFWIGIAGALVLVAGCVVAAPSLGRFSPGPEVVPVLQLLSLHVLLMALGHVHEFLLRRELGFKSMLVPQLGNGAVKGAVSIGLAFAGFGVWSLVFGQLAGSAARTVLLWVVKPWRPRLAFSREAAGPMLRYGLGVSAVSILGELSRNLDYLVVGSVLGSTALGFYFIAFRVPELVIMSGFRVGQQVLFPFYSRLRDVAGPDEEEQRRQLARGYYRTLRLGALVSFPAAFGMAALASPIVLTLYGGRWQPAVVPFALIALWAGFYALVIMPGTLYKAMGRAGLLTAVSVVQVAMLAPALWLAAPHGIAAVAGAHVGVAILEFALLSIVAGRVLRVPSPPVLLRLLPPLALAAFMGGAVLVLVRAVPPLAGLILGPPCGALVYGLAMRLFLPGEFRELWDHATRLWRRGSAAGRMPSGVRASSTGGP